MPSLLIFGEEIVVLSGAITDKWVIKLFCVRIIKDAMFRSSLQQKI